MTQIAKRIANLKQRIVSAAQSCAVDPSTITLLAVSKGRSIEEIFDVVAAGVCDIGENRVKEAKEKFQAIKEQLGPERRVRMHMVGHLQSNKVKDAVRIFDLIHSLDSIDLAQCIDKEAGIIGKIQDVLIEVKTSAEANKYGFLPQEVSPAIKTILKFKHIRIRGLMTIAALSADPAESSVYFDTLVQLRTELCAGGIDEKSLRILSMGMSDDFELAIKAGANVLRIGRLIFED